MALNLSTLRKPLNPQVVDPSTGLMREEWQFYFAELTGQLNSATGELGTDKAPAGAEYLVGASNAALTAERVAANSTSNSFNLATPGQVAVERAALTGDVTASANSNATTIANDAVTYAKMQNVSATARILGRKTASAGDPEECTLSEVLDFIGSAAQGDILYRGASAWARLGAGTDGQFLETSGPGANPQWSTLSAWQKISAVTANDSATIDFTGLDTSAFAAFAITISNMVPATDGTSFSIRTDEDNGSSFDSGASDYQYAFTSSLSDGTSDPEGDAAHTQMVCTATLGNAGEENAGGIIFLFLGGARAAFITWDLALLNPSALLRNAKGAGCRNGISTGVDAVRLFMTSGNITSGIFTLYGMPA